LNEQAHDGVRHLRRLRGLDDNAGLPSEILVAGDAADTEPKPYTGFDPETVLHLDRGKGDVVGVFQHRDTAGAVEGDVEFARQAIERAVVQDVMMPLARVRACVDQFLRIDTGGRRSRDVANVVRAGAARAQAEILNAFDQRDAVPGQDFPDLYIGASGHVAVTAAI